MDDYVVLSTPSYHELEESVNQQKKEIAELTEKMKKIQDELFKLRENKMKRIIQLEKKVKELEISKSRI